MKERSSVVVEEYLQAIFSLQGEKEPLKATALVKWLKSSPSTVHATLSRLQMDKHVKVTKKKEIRLTKKGSEMAKSLTRRHRLVEWFLCDTLGISWHEVHEHAHIFEHGLTQFVEEKLAAFLGFPKSCPHGTPLPGEDDFLPKNTKNLDTFEVGDKVEIVNISEILEESIELMKFFMDKSIKPGKHHNILEKTDITKTIVLESKMGTAILTFDIAAKIGAFKL